MRFSSSKEPKRPAIGVEEAAGREADPRIGVTDLRPLEASLDEVCETIDATRWAVGLTWAQVQVLAEHVEPYSIEKGQIIFRQGAVEAYMCLLVEGKVRIVKDGPGDEPRTLAEITAGKTFGEMALVDGEPRSAAALALEPCHVLVITRAAFERLSRDNPKLALVVMAKIARLMSQRLRLTSGLLIDYLEG